MLAHLKKATISGLFVRSGKVYNVPFAQVYQVDRAMAEPRTGREIHVAVGRLVRPITEDQFLLYSPKSASD